MPIAHLPHSAPHPAPDPVWPLKRFSIEEYHRLIDSGALNEDDNLELLDGWLVKKMPKNPLHDNTVDLLNYLLNHLLPRGWFVRVQNVISTQESEPEPDLAVVQGAPGEYPTQHPGGGDVALIVEVAHSSVETDREKRRIYARAGVPVYWIVNLDERCVEVFTELRGRGRARDYAAHERFGLKKLVDVIIAGKACGTIPVGEIIKV